MNTFIQFAFRQFYTRFAWTYDAVAALVSFGEWKVWGQAALGFVPINARVLEVAHGPGHLHVAMQQRGYAVFSFDLSPQMTHLLRAKVRAHGLPSKQFRASATQLPVASNQFDCAIATFPASFIFASATLKEMHRVLKPSGTLVVVPSARFRGDGFWVKLVAWAYRITGQMQQNPAPIRALFNEYLFSFTEHTHTTTYADVTVWVCKKI